MAFELTDVNLLNYAMKHYDNPECKSIEEFQEDLTRTKYIKRLFRKYKTSGELKERLLLNHIIIFYNVFGIEAATNILFFKIEIFNSSINKIHQPFLIKRFLNKLEWTRF